MAHISSVTLEVADPSAADAFYAAAFGLGDTVRVRASDASHRIAIGGGESFTDPEVFVCEAA